MQKVARAGKEVKSKDRTEEGRGRRGGKDCELESAAPPATLLRAGLTGSGCHR